VSAVRDSESAKQKVVNMTRELDRMKATEKVRAALSLLLHLLPVLFSLPRASSWRLRRRQRSNGVATSRRRLYRRWRTLSSGK